MNNPLVSIIIPCYNSEKWIATTIQSALEQSYPNIEVIVIDDGSTDNSLNIIKSFEGKIIWKTGSNKGGCSARNIGLRLAKGEYIQFLDADDLLHSNKIQAQMDILCEDQKSVAICPYKILGEQGQYSCEQGKDCQPPVNSSNPVEWLVWKLYSGQCFAMMPHCYLTPRKLIESVGFWDESLSINQDGEFFSRVLLSANSVKFVSDGLVFYRRESSSSVSRGRTIQHASSALKVCRLYAKRLLMASDSLYSRRALRKEYLRFIYIYYLQYPNLGNQAVDEIYGLGFKELGYCGGKRFKILCNLFGFMNALKLTKSISGVLTNVF
mgnify:CR=1 FL=1